MDGDAGMGSSFLDRYFSQMSSCIEVCFLDVAFPPQGDCLYMTVFLRGWNISLVREKACLDIDRL